MLIVMILIAIVSIPKMGAINHWDFTLNSVAV